MADNADQAAERGEIEHRRIMESHQEAAKKRELEPIQECHWCFHPFEAGSRRLFCDGCCADQYERVMSLGEMRRM